MGDIIIQEHQHCSHQEQEYPERLHRKEVFPTKRSIEVQKPKILISLKVEIGHISKNTNPSQKDKKQFLGLWGTGMNWNVIPVLVQLPSGYGGNKVTKQV